ncbi:hypothetical protein F5Y11DRAFT_315769 [Daldinia sp. FL1419]|nr:hypothetical protein F5Y11DRAFT_315769 [Daldinia sp. FL1419]
MPDTMSAHDTRQQMGDSEPHNPPPYNEEEEWALDDAQERIRAHYGSHDGQSQHWDLNAARIGGPGLSLPVTPQRLPYPIIIPQRRPGQRTRGFIRAYAPDLMRFGIDESMFMGFLDQLDKATASSPLVGAINFAANFAGFIPSAIGSTVGLAVQVTAGVYQEMRSRKNQNGFLVKMNDELFRPRGLYCFIMAYNPESKNTLIQQDINAGSSSQANARSEFRSNDGITGPIEFPASAELVFPDLEDSSSDDDDDDDKGSSSKSGFSKTFEAFNERRDLKAQRKYLRKNPTSAMNSLMDPKVELTEKDYKKQQRRLEKDERKREKRERKQEKRARKHPERAPKGPRKRLLRKDILYITIINMPSMKEMEEAARIVGSPLV